MAKPQMMMPELGAVMDGVNFQAQNALLDQARHEAYFQQGQVHVSPGSAVFRASINGKEQQSMEVSAPSPSLGMDWGLNLYDDSKATYKTSKRSDLSTSESSGKSSLVPVVAMAIVGLEPPVHVAYSNTSTKADGSTQKYSAECVADYNARHAECTGQMRDGTGKLLFNLSETDDTSNQSRQYSSVMTDASNNEIGTIKIGVHKGTDDSTFVLDATAAKK